MNDKEHDENIRLSFEQTCETARHYSNLRFAMFTVFTAILGGLFAVELGVVGPIPDGGIVIGFRIGAIILTTLFALGEWRVAMLVVFYQEEAKRFESKSAGLSLPLPESHLWYKNCATWIMLAPFIMAWLFWIGSLFISPRETIKSSSHRSDDSAVCDSTLRIGAGP